jgi:hypothetical protein
MIASEEPFASVYDGLSRVGVILARGRSGFETPLGQTRTQSTDPQCDEAACQSY